jgi:hypothetical protein
LRFASRSGYPQRKVGTSESSARVCRCSPTDIVSHRDDSDRGNGQRTHWVGVSGIGDAFFCFDPMKRVAPTESGAAGWMRMRNRWEYSHVVRAGLARMNTTRSVIPQQAGGPAKETRAMPPKAAATKKASTPSTPSTQARRGWTPPGLRRSIRGRRRYDINVYG